MITAGYCLCLFSFALAPLICSDWEGSEKFKLKMYVSTMYWLSSHNRFHTCIVACPFVFINQDTVRLQYSTWYLPCVAERSRALIYLSWSVRRVFESHARHIHILNVWLPSRYEWLSRVNANEIKHDRSPAVTVVLDPWYNKSYKALYF